MISLPSIETGEFGLVRILGKNENESLIVSITSKTILSPNCVATFIPDAKENHF